MQNKYASIIIILIVLLIVSMAALFFAKDNVISFFSNQEDLASLSEPIKIVPSANVIDDSVIKSDRFKTLKNNVNNFEYANICTRPNNVAVVVKAVALKNPDGSEATSTAPIDISCRQGNNNPFLVKKK